MGLSVEESDFCRALVKFISLCKPSKSCWYSLKVVSLDIPCLPEVMGLSYSSMMYMFQCCGLACRRNDADDWKFLSNKFSNFQSSYGLEATTDLISSKIYISNEANDGKKKRKQVYFICLGVQELKSINFAGVPTKAPRINGIVSARLEFHDMLWKLGTQYQKLADESYTLFEKFLGATEAAGTVKSTISEATLKDNDHGPQPGLVLSGGPSVIALETKQEEAFPLYEPMAPTTPPPGKTNQEPSLLINRIRNYLLPLLLKDDIISQMDNFWRGNVDEKQIELALLTIVGCIHEEKERKLSSILEAEQLELSPNTLSNESKLPKLRQYGIPLDNKLVHQALLRDLYYVSKKTTSPSSTSIPMELKTGEERSLVLIPRPTNFKNMVRNEKEAGWFSELMKAIGGGHGQNSEEKTIQFVCHILAQKHRETFVEAVKQTGTQLIEPLDPIATFALQSVCNLPGSKMKLLKRFLEAELGARVFSSPREIKQVLGMDSVLPITGTFHYSGSTDAIDPRSREKIPFMYKSVKDIVRLLIRMQIRDKQEEFDWNHLDISTCIDHGKGFLRATLICVLRKLDHSYSGGKSSVVLLFSYSSFLTAFFHPHWIVQVF